MPKSTLPTYHSFSAPPLLTSFVPAGASANVHSTDLPGTGASVTIGFSVGTGASVTTGLSVTTGASVTIGASVGTGASVAAVSYTHLDVYKRQT